MSDHDDRATVTETGGGDGIVGILIAGLILIGVFFLFGDQLSGGPKNIGDDVNLAKVETPAKQ